MLLETAVESAVAAASRAAGQDRRGTAFISCHIFWWTPDSGGVCPTSRIALHATHYKIDGSNPSLDETKLPNILNIFISELTFVMQINIS